MPKRVGRPRAKRRSAKRRAPVRRRMSKIGGKVKPSDVFGGISAAATGASVLGFDAPITLPIAGVTGIAAGIARLFGAGGLTKQQAQVLMRAQRHGLVLGKRQPSARRQLKLQVQRPRRR